MASIKDSCDSYIKFIKTQLDLFVVQLVSMQSACESIISSIKRLEEFKQERQNAPFITLQVNTSNLQPEFRNIFKEYHKTSMNALRTEILEEIRSLIKDLIKDKSSASVQDGATYTLSPELECLKLTRSQKILALVPLLNASSDDESVISDSENIFEPPSSPIISSDPPSLDSSYENLNIFGDDGDYNETVHAENYENVPLTPTLEEIFPSPSTNNYEAIPTLNSIQSLPSPSVATDSPDKPLTRRKRKKTPTVIARNVKKTKLVLSYNWRRAAFKHRAVIDDDLYKLHKTHFDTVLDYFYYFFSPGIITHITENTNLYSVQKSGRSIQVTEDDIKSFLAIEVIMGIVKMPAYTDYWAKSTRYAQVADIMSLKRYEQIRRHIHFVDNLQDDSSDKYFKIRPVMEKIRQSFLQLEEEGQYSIDEMMIPYKGRKAGKRKQYIKNKPKKWGFKNFVRAGVSGLIYDFIIYGGSDTFRGYNFSDTENGLGLGGQVVIALCQSIKKRPSKIYADNFFTSPELIYILREQYGIFSLGTIRTNRLRGCQDLLPTDLQMRKKKRGYSKQLVCNKNKLAVVKWHDNKVVTTISSYIDSYPIEKIKRYCKESKCRIDVECPQVIKEYNKYMGGVDLADMLISMYRTPLKSRRWYLGIFAQLLDMCINNAWLLYRRDNRAKLLLKDFRYDVYESLRGAGRTIEYEGTSADIPDARKIQKPKPVTSRPVESVRLDNIGHFPETQEKKARCRYCKEGKTRVYCIKCNVTLCFVVGEKKSRNCFRQFHTK